MMKTLKREGTPVRVRCGYTGKVYSITEWEEVMAEAASEWSEDEFAELIHSASFEIPTPQYTSKRIV